MKNYINELKNFILEVVCRFAANLINDLNGFQHQAEPDAEHALRQALTKHSLNQRDAIEQVIENRIAAAEGNLIARIQDALCEGMNIECEPETSLKDLFALIDTSISRRIARSEELHGSVHQKIELDEGMMEVLKQGVVSGKIKMFGGNE